MSSRARLEELTNLVPRGDDVWTTVPPSYDQPRLFGGHALAVCLSAGSRTVGEDQPIHAVHAQYLRTVPAMEEVELAIERVRDGRSVIVRRALLKHDDKVAVTVDLSYHRAEDAPVWQSPSSLAQASEPLTVEDGALGRSKLLDPFEVVPIHRYVRDTAVDVHPYWVRSRSDLGADPLLHVCAFAWLSDLAVSATAFGPPTKRRDQLAAVTVEHSLWFHRPPIFDGWFQVQAAPVLNAGGRGLVHGQFVAADGTVGPVFTQDVLLRRTADDAG